MQAHAQFDEYGNLREEDLRGQLAEGGMIIVASILGAKVLQVKVDPRVPAVLLNSTARSAAPAAASATNATMVHSSVADKVTSSGDGANPKAQGWRDTLVITLRAGGFLDAP